MPRVATEPPSDWAWQRTSVGVVVRSPSGPPASPHAPCGPHHGPRPASATATEVGPAADRVPRGPSSGMTELARDGESAPPRIPARRRSLAEGAVSRNRRSDRMQRPQDGLDSADNTCMPSCGLALDDGVALARSCSSVSYGYGNQPISAPVAVLRCCAAGRCVVSCVLTTASPCWTVNLFHPPISRACCAVPL
jgi:hypothetical protein